jgi:hypothetical protein
MDHLISYWARYFYLVPMLIACSILAAIALITSDKPLEFKRLFIIYTISLFVLFISVNFCAYLKYKFPESALKISFFWELANIVFCIIEAYVFLKFLSCIIESALVRKFARVCFISLLIINVFTAFSIYQSRSIDYISYKTEILCSINFAVILPFLPVYFFQVYQANEKFNSPIALLALGITAYTSLSIPGMLLATRLLHSYYVLFELNYCLHFINLIIVCLLLINYSRSTANHTNFEE